MNEDFSPTGLKHALEAYPQGALVVYLAGAHLSEQQVLGLMARFCGQLGAIVDQNGAVVVVPEYNIGSAYAVLDSALAENDGLRASLHVLPLRPEPVVIDADLKATGMSLRCCACSGCAFACTFACTFPADVGADLQDDFVCGFLCFAVWC